MKRGEKNRGFNSMVEYQILEEVFCNPQKLYSWCNVTVRNKKMQVQILRKKTFKGS